MWRKKKGEPRCVAVCIYSVKFFIPQMNRCAFISVWLAATRAFWTLSKGHTCVFHNLFFWGLCLATKLWDGITHRENSTDRSYSFFTSPVHHEAHRQSERSYVLVCAYEKVDLLIQNVCVSTVRDGGLVCMTSKCVCLFLCVRKLW